MYIHMTVCTSSTKEEHTLQVDSKEDIKQLIADMFGVWTVNVHQIRYTDNKFRYLVDEMKVIIEVELT